MAKFVLKTEGLAREPPRVAISWTPSCLCAVHRPQHQPLPPNFTASLLDTQTKYQDTLLHPGKSTKNHSLWEEINPKPLSPARSSLSSGFELSRSKISLTATTSRSMRKLLQELRRNSELPGRRCLFPMLRTGSMSFYKTLRTSRSPFLTPIDTN